MDLQEVFTPRFLQFFVLELIVFIIRFHQILVLQLFFPPMVLEFKQLESIYLKLLLNHFLINDLIKHHFRQIKNLSRHSRKEWFRPGFINQVLLISGLL
jgi:hypothetical protein